MASLKRFSVTLITMLLVGAMAKPLRAQSAADDLVTRTFNLRPTGVLDGPLQSGEFQFHSPLTHPDAITTTKLQEVFATVGIQLPAHPFAQPTKPNSKAMF